jgi:hypothetical protein
VPDVNEMCSQPVYNWGDPALDTAGPLAVEQTQEPQELVSAGTSDNCANCGAPLAADQRYCVECGERRGRARFSFESLVVPKTAAPAAPKQPRRPRLSSSFSFTAGVATLLLALGVGVLIGHNTNNSKPVSAAAPSQTIKIEGGGGSTNNTTANKSAGKTSSNSFKAKTVHLSAKVVKKVNAAASTVLGSGTSNLSSNPTQQVGSSCSGGAGCQGGKFTGNFFGGG